MKYEFAADLQDRMEEIVTVTDNSSDYLIYF